VDEHHREAGPAQRLPCEKKMRAPSVALRPIPSPLVSRGKKV